MNADYVENIIRNIDKQSYKCILVDGAWGIGKSYMVRKALEDMKDRTCFISLFGMDDCQKIYHEVLFQFAFRTSRGGKIASSVQNFAKAAGNFCTEVSNLNSALAQTVSERELFARIAASFKKNRIIVIDDLERRKSGLDLEELFGVIENLKQLNYIKVILIANSKEIHKEDKEVFDKYKEKIIDRIFDVTEHSTSIKWFDFGIDGAFINGFLAKHNVKNLRTLQKAQNFFNEVSLYCSEIKDDKFISEIRQMCFAIVVEDTDKLYYETLPEFSEQDAADNQKRLARVLAELGNEMKSRLRQYTWDLKSGKALVERIYKYYENEKVLTKEEIGVYYRQYLKVGTAPNNYKSEEEIRRYIEGWKTEIDEANESTELTFLVGEYDRWYQVLGEDDKELIETYEKKLEEFLVDEAKTITPNPLNYYRGCEFDNATQKVREIYDEVLKRAKCRLVQDYIEYLFEKTNDETAQKYSGQLRDWYTDSTDIGKYIEDNLERLFTENSFPVFGMNDCKYYTCCNIIKMLYQKDSEHFVERYKELKTSFDRMSIYRTEMILRELEILNQINK